MPSDSPPQKAKRRRAGYTLHLLAGSTGELVHRLLEVAVTQFRDAKITIVDHPLIDSEAKLRSTLRSLSDRRAIVVHALPTDAAKQAVREWCIPRGVCQFDATGPLIDFLAGCVNELPENSLDRLHQVDEAYQRRIEAMEFALQHDDGLGLTTLREADIVIVGVSRVSKSPTTLFLASRGYKVANVSIARETGFPKDLAKISQKKIVALTTQPKRLQEIRTERAARMGLGESTYDDLPTIIRELAEVEAEYRRRKWPIIDVTDRAIERTAAEIIELLQLANHRVSY